MVVTEAESPGVGEVRAEEVVERLFVALLQRLESSERFPPAVAGVLEGVEEIEQLVSCFERIGHLMSADEVEREKAILKSCPARKRQIHFRAESWLRKEQQPSLRVR